MLKVPIEAKKIRVSLHWANSAEELAEDVNGNLEAYPDHGIYGMSYQLAMVIGEDKKRHERHCMAVFFRP